MDWRIIKTISIHTPLAGSDSKNKQRILPGSAIFFVKCNLSTNLLLRCPGRPLMRRVFPIKSGANLPGILCSLGLRNQTISVSAGEYVLFAPKCSTFFS